MKFEEKFKEVLNKILKKYEKEMSGDDLYGGIIGNAFNYAKINLLKQLQDNPEKVREWVIKFREGVRQDLEDIDDLLKIKENAN